MVKTNVCCVVFNLLKGTGSLFDCFKNKGELWGECDNITYILCVQIYITKRNIFNIYILLGWNQSVKSNHQSKSYVMKRNTLSRKWMTLYRWLGAAEPPDLWAEIKFNTKILTFFIFSSLFVSEVRSLLAGFLTRLIVKV